MTKLAYSVQEVCKIAGIGRTTLYAAIKDGALASSGFGEDDGGQK